MKKILLLFLGLIFLCGCSTLSYSGNDYSSSNVETVKTNEDFVFDTYKKSLDNANFKVGISKTPIMEVMVLYVRVENLSYETPYTFKVEDLVLKNNEKRIPFVKADSYISTYQAQEAASMGSLSTLAPTIQNMTGMSANYNDVNQAMIQNASEQANRSTYEKMDQLGKDILKHSTQTSSNISPRKSRYFYFFFENEDTFPLTVNYKTLSWQFGK